MEYCVRCVMPNTKPGVFLDKRGLCNACRSQEMKQQVDWSSRRKELEEIVDKIKATNKSSYDCLYICLISTIISVFLFPEYLQGIFSKKVLDLNF